MQLRGNECNASEPPSGGCGAAEPTEGESNRHDPEGAEELTGSTTRRSLHELEQPLPSESSSFDDWITMVIKVPTAIAPGAVCKIFSPDGRAHFVTVPTSLPPGGSFIKALPKAYTEEVLKTLDRSEMKQWLRHRLELAGQAEQQKYNTLNSSRQELLRTCVQWLRDTKAQVLQEAAAQADTGHEDPSDVAWRPAWSGTYERPYWWHPVTRDTVWERPGAPTATCSKQPGKVAGQDDEAELPTPPGSSDLDVQVPLCPTHGECSPDPRSAPGGSIRVPAPAPPVSLAPG